MDRNRSTSRGPVISRLFGEGAPPGLSYLDSADGMPGENAINVPRAPEATRGGPASGANRPAPFLRAKRPPLPFPAASPTSPDLWSPGGATGDLFGVGLEGMILRRNGP